MAYLSIQDFKYGMDRRRERVAGTPGTLWTLENAHITRGADIERCKKFVPTYSLPAGTHGCYALNRRLYAFGSADLAGSMPLGVAYQRLQSPNSGTMTDVVDVLGFAGKLYVIADFADGGRFHFYDGTRVTDWDAIGAASSDFDSLAQFLAEKMSADNAVTAVAKGATIEVTAKVPGTPFTLAGTAVNGGSTDDQTVTIATPQANVAAVAEVLATASITVAAGTGGAIATVTLDGVSLISGPVPFNGTGAATAIRLAQAINNMASVTNYTAVAFNGAVTISAATGTGAAANGKVLGVTTTGSIAVSADATMAGGVTAIAAVAQVSTAALGGTYEADDVFTITLNGTAYVATGLASGTGRSLYVDYRRVWSPAGSLWRYCKLADATVWNPAAAGSDAGFLNVATDSEGNENLVVARRYQNLTAVYSEQAIVVYSLDTDPANFAVNMVLDNTSTSAAKSPIRYGNNDVFHLDPTGIRSLRALNSSNAPFVSDVGNAIDTFVLAFLDTLTEKQRRAAISAIEPRDGRFWMAVGNRIFILSFFPGAKISAWSYYSPGFEVEAFAKIDKKLYLRSGDTIYLYGGADGNTYPDTDELPVLVETPFLSAGTPATKKGLDGFDAAFTNEWQVDLLIDPNREDKTTNVGKIVDRTYGAEDISVPGQATMLAARMTCTRAGRATVSMMQIHFTKQDEG
jgi:hypothetical protein